jgi:hypothetical protein
MKAMLYGMGLLVTSTGYINRLRKFSNWVQRFLQQEIAQAKDSMEAANQLQKQNDNGMTLMGSNRGTYVETNPKDPGVDQVGPGTQDFPN